MADMVLPSKLVPEQITVTFDFLDELEWGDTIFTAGVECTVAVGEDPNPRNLLRQELEIFPTYVEQKIKQGIPGVIYRLVCAAVTNLGGIIDKKVLVAILPSQALTPDLFGIPYTTDPYPIDFTESFRSECIWVSADALTTVPYDFEESITSSISWLAGTVQLAPEYDYPDHITCSITWVSAVVQISQQYTFEEDITCSIEWRTGAVQSAVPYVFSEDIQPSIVWIAGSSP